MVEQMLAKSAEELQFKFQDAIKRHHTNQREMAKYCDTNETQFSKAIHGDPSPRSQQIREKAAGFLGIDI